MHKYLALFCLTIAAVANGEDCATELAGMKECMHQNKGAKYESMKAAVQECFDDLGCELPEPPADKKSEFKICHERVFEMVKPMLEECMQENSLLSSFTLPDKDGFKHGDDLDRVMFMLRRFGHRGHRGRRSSSSEETDGQQDSSSSSEEDDGSDSSSHGSHGPTRGHRGSGSHKGGRDMPNPFDQCPGLKDCIKEAHPDPATGEPDQKPDREAMMEKFAALKQQCFDDLGVSDACQAIDMKEEICKCGTVVATENVDEIVDELATCLEEQGKTDVDVAGLKNKIWGFVGKMCQPKGHGRKHAHRRFH
jgi:hypothetical protein